MNPDDPFRPFLPLADASADTAQGGEPSLAASVRNMGRTVTIRTYDPSQASSSPRDVVYVEFDKPEVCTLMLQASGPGIGITITTGIGGSARFTRTFPILVGIPTSLRLFGRFVEVQAFSLTNGAPVVVTGAVVKGDVSPFGELWSTYQRDINALAGALGSGGTICPLVLSATPTQAGKLLKAHGSLVGGTAGANYWLMFFDQAAASVGNGSNALYAIGPLVGGQPSSFSIDDTSRPDVFFNTGLQWSLSTTPAHLTAPTDGATARVDCSWGT